MEPATTELSWKYWFHGYHTDQMIFVVLSHWPKNNVNKYWSNFDFTRCMYVPGQWLRKNWNQGIRIIARQLAFSVMAASITSFLKRDIALSTFLLQIRYNQTWFNSNVIYATHMHVLYVSFWLATVSNLMTLLNIKKQNVLWKEQKETINVQLLNQKQIYIISWKLNMACASFSIGCLLGIYKTTIPFEDYCGVWIRISLLHASRYKA